MSPVEWYYSQGDKQQGPASPAEIKALADGGRLLPEDLVWREGMEEWIPARKVKGLFGAEEPAVAKPPQAVPQAVLQAAPKETPQEVLSPASPPAFEKSPAAFQRAREGPARHLFDFVLELARSQLTAHFVESTSKIFAVCGHYGLYLAMLVLLGFSMVFGVKANELNPILVGTAGVVILVVLQYAASRFVGTLEKLNRSTSGTVSSAALPDCVSLLLGVGGLVALFGLAVLAIQTETFLFILPAIATFILCEYMATVALNPETLNLTIAPDGTAGEEAIGVFSFFIKLGVRTAPVAFGVGVVWGTIGLLVASALVVLPPGADSPLRLIPASVFFGFDRAVLPWDTAKLELVPAATAASQAAKTLITAAALPVVAYLFFIFYHLLIDVLRAILAIPSKLDRLGGGMKDEG